MPRTSTHLGLPLPDPPNDSRTQGEGAVREFLEGLDFLVWQLQNAVAAIGHTGTPSFLFDGTTGELLVEGGDSLVETS